MIELTKEQHLALAESHAGPSRVRDPETDATYVLIREEVYQRIKELLYDDSPWTDEEMDALAAEDVDRLGWEGMEPYQEPST